MDNEPLDYEEFINNLDDYVPIIPDEVINYYLNRTGFSCTDDKMKRLISLATQKFISDVTNDSLQYCKIRLQGGARDKVVKGKEKSLVLSLEDLSPALKEYGIDIRKPEYFAENIPQEITTPTTNVGSSITHPTTTTTTTTTTATTTSATATSTTAATTTSAPAAESTTTTEQPNTPAATPSTAKEDNDSPPKKQKTK
ncbi:hypothetical protein CYY_008853 [Polysphondylium violaceum]|uniref:Transcription initiation factor TFIID subunit 10 n=1 Tax=Polysphondylium violaceum TaxID=133409 RepID=A0A8J4PNR1_9MYCE|nr:hypothetical protein CYY_008853 [Polysphondylium violaceum]